MNRPGEEPRRNWPPTFPSAVGVLALAVLIVTAAPAGRSQSAADRPTFEVASVKPLAQGDRNFRFGFQPGGRFVSSVPLQVSISFAYDLPFNQSPRLTGGPDWIRSQDAAYDIEATGVFPDGLSDKARTDRQRLMVQALLADRFKLVIHRETKEIPVYALVVAKGGPKLQKADVDEKDCPDSSASPPPDPTTLCHTFMGGRGRGIHARAVSIAELVNGMQNWTDRPLVDKTGVQGLYHIETSPWLPMQVGPPPAPGATQDGVSVEELSTIFDVFDKLGLKMQPQKDKVDIYVIDSIEKPTEN